jgi:hypothetical protein
MNEIQRINPPSGVILNERKYPVITNDPSFSDICESAGASLPSFFCLQLPADAAARPAAVVLQLAT